MHSEVRQCLETILPAALQHADRLPRDEAPFAVWTRDGSVWRGSHDIRPVLPLLERLYPEELAERFKEVMSKHHPEHLGLVGSSVSGLIRLDADYLLHRMISEIWSRYESLAVSDDVIGLFVEEFAAFVDATHIRVSYTAPVVNLRVDPDVAEIPLSAAVSIKHLSDADVTALYGGRADMGPLAGRSAPQSMPDYALVGEFAEPKRFERNPPGSSEQFQQVQTNLRTAVLALRSFKSGPVGYDELHLKPLGLCPLPSCIQGYGAHHIPLGRYELKADEVADLCEHARHLGRHRHPALDLAISRLSDAEVRLSPRDKIVDAVIGLEAILLFMPRGERYRQELRYRFAMNYASLAGAAQEKLLRLGTAKGVYDCRSTLVHGGHIDEERVELGTRKVTLAQAAETACEMLREVVKKFLPKGEAPAFSRPQYWDKRLLGPPDAED